MDKITIKNYLKNFLKEEATPAIGLAKKIKKENGKTNKEGVKNIEKDSLEYNKNLKQDKDTSKVPQNKITFDDKFEKTYHDEMEIMNGQEMLQYDLKPTKTFTERAEEAIAGSSKMGNNPEWANVVEKKQGFQGPEFGKNLVKKIKDSTKKRSEETPTLNLRGRDIQADLKDTGHRPYAIEENKTNNTEKIKESMKRLKFKNEFNGLGNALKLIPEGYRVDKKEFEMTDGNETYRIRWEGTLSEGKAVVLTASDKTMMNEDIKRMKELFGYKSQDTLGLVKGNARVNENKVFGDIWNKSKILLEGEDIESAKTKENNWEETTKKAPEATKHIEGTTSTDKGTKAPKAKEGDASKAVSQAPEAKKHVESSTAKATEKAKEGYWDEVKGGEKMMDINAPAPKEGEWAEIKISQAAEAKKHVQGSVSTDKGTQAPAPKEGLWDEIKMSQSSEAKKHIHLKESEEESEEEMVEMVMREIEGDDDDNETTPTETKPEEPSTSDDDDNTPEPEDDSDNWKKPDAAFDADEKEPTPTDIKKTGSIDIATGGGEEEDSIGIPTTSKFTLLFSPSSGIYWIKGPGLNQQVPAEHMAIANDKSKKVGIRAAEIARLMQDAEGSSEEEEMGI